MLEAVPVCVQATLDGRLVGRVPAGHLGLALLGDPGGKVCALLNLLHRGHLVQDYIQLLGQHLGGHVGVLAEVHVHHASLPHVLYKLFLVKVLVAAFL